MNSNVEELFFVSWLFEPSIPPTYAVTAFIINRLKRTKLEALGYHHFGGLTYTPSSMKFLNKILSRPSNEKPFMILVVGYPSETALVPAIRKKALEDISLFI